jgi:arylsulfatase A-like enzyme
MPELKSLNVLAPALPIILLAGSCNTSVVPDRTKPNVVIIFLDDAGWSDFEPFHKNHYPTPNLNLLASQGTQFHNFYVPQAVCSASRAALLSGCYPCRTGLHNAHGPNATGLDTTFRILPQLMKEAGYVTGAFGKWHIGDQEHTRPHNRGFDEHAGIMYSNDMWAGHPENPEYWGRYPLRFWENGEITIDSVTHEHQPHFTTWFTEKAVDFIGQHKDDPFFLYVPHPQPHVPLFVSEKFAGKSGTGLYGDVIMEIDWSVGQIMKALDDNGIADNTIVIFSSDNGPWISYGNHAGKTPFREAKGTSWDGGIRSPLVIRYPGKVPAGEISLNTFSTIDLLPTLANLTGSPLPDNPIDGKDVWPIIMNAEDATHPHDYYAISLNYQLQAIISGDGKWKLHLPHNYRTLNTGGKDGIPGKFMQASTDWALFDMIHDPQERQNVIGVYPEIAERLIRFAEEHNREFYE